MIKPHGFRFKNRKLEFLIQVYVWGILLTGLLAVVLAFTRVTVPSFLILIAGVLHLLWLIFLSFQLNNVQERYRSYVLTQAANRIQSAGYLHTLIGFLYAISSLGNLGSDASNLAVPLSSALVTSLLGWLAGGEIAAKGEYENPNVEQATRQVVIALENYSIKLTDIQSNYTQRLETEYKKRINDMLAFQKNLTERLETDHENRVQSMLLLQEEHTTRLEESHKQHAEKILKFYEESNDKLKKMHYELDKTSTAVSGSLDIFSRVLNSEQSKIQISLQNFCSIIDQQNADFKASIKPYKTASAEIGEHSRVLSESIRSLSANGTKAVQEMSKVLKSMEKASEYVQAWSRKAGNSVREVNQLLVELNKTKSLSTRKEDEV